MMIANKKKLTKKQRKAASAASRQERIRKDMDVLDNYAKKYAIKNCELLFIDSGDVAITDKQLIDELGVQLAQSMNSEMAHLTHFKRRKILSMLISIMAKIMDEMDESRCLTQAQRVEFISSLEVKS